MFDNQRENHGVNMTEINLTLKVCYKLPKMSYRDFRHLHYKLDHFYVTTILFAALEDGIHTGFNSTFSNKVQ